MQRSTIQAAQSTQRLQASRDLAWIVGMHCARAAVVSGVERREQIDHFGAADLADDDAVRPHPQGLADELADCDFPDAFDVGASGYQPDQMRMRRRKFSGVLDAHDPLVGRDRIQHRRQQSRFARPGAAGHQKRQPGGDDVSEQCGSGRRNGARCDQRGQILSGRPQHPQ